MATNNWTIDPAHSELEFKIRHLVISTITGKFRIFSGTMVTARHDDFGNAIFTLEADVYSIDTNNRDRDEHLKSPDFFNADAFPKIEFKSTSFVHVEGDEHKLTGLLTIKGITKEVVLDVLFGGEAKDGFGISRAGFEINGVINRNDFDIHSADVTEAGGLVLGEDIRLHANIQFTNDSE
ncbi:YceI family protein [Flavobacterium sp.]|uniref:YceI family protein n=1 Tax=Flavobacterium sp. TaxID=239 RepID=UPI0040341CB4